MNGPEGTMFTQWRDAVLWARLRARATGVRQTVKQSGYWWRVAPR